MGIVPSKAFPFRYFVAAEYCAQLLKNALICVNCANDIAAFHISGGLIIPHFRADVILQMNSAFRFVSLVNAALRRHIGLHQLKAFEIHRIPSVIRIAVIIHMLLFCAGGTEQYQ